MSIPIQKAQNCCTPCDEPVVTNVPGTPGADGAPGTNGTNGINAFTALTAQFTMPGELDTVVADVVTSAWATIGQVVFVQFAGYFLVVAKPSATQVTLLNVENALSDAYLTNVTPGTIIPSGATVSPGGMQGPAGASGSGTLNDLSPTDSLGDILVDGGANNPAADLNRFAAGVDGTRLMADSGQALGLIWALVDLSDVTQITGAAAIANGGTGQTTQTAAFNALSPVTTRGDIIVRDATNNVRKVLGATGTVLQSDGTDPVYAKIGTTNLDTTVGRAPLNTILVQEQQTAGTAGGAFTQGAWRTRALNTEVIDTGANASVAASQITLAAGTYRIRAWAVANQCGSHQIRLQNITAGTTIAYGMSALADATNAGLTASHLSYRFTLAGSTVIELQHQCQTTKATDGFGVAVNFASLEIYSEVYLEREAL